jgi:hypothetical protein
VSVKLNFSLITINAIFEGITMDNKQIDIKESLLYRLDHELLSILLKDRSSGKKYIDCPAETLGIPVALCTTASLDEMFLRSIHNEEVLLYETS